MNELTKVQTIDDDFMCQTEIDTSTDYKTFDYSSYKLNPSEDIERELYQKVYININVESKLISFDHTGTLKGIHLELFLKFINEFKGELK